MDPCCERGGNLFRKQCSSHGGETSGCICGELTCPLLYPAYLTLHRLMFKSTRLLSQGITCNALHPQDMMTEECTSRGTDHTAPDSDGEGSPGYASDEKYHQPDWLAAIRSGLPFELTARVSDVRSCPLCNLGTELSPCARMPPAQASNSSALLSACMASEMHINLYLPCSCVWLHRGSHHEHAVGMTLCMRLMQLGLKQLRLMHLRLLQLRADAVEVDAVEAAVEADAVEDDAFDADAVKAAAVEADAVRADAVEVDRRHIEIRHTWPLPATHHLSEPSLYGRQGAAGLPVIRAPFIAHNASDDAEHSFREVRRHLVFRDLHGRGYCELYLHRMLSPCPMMVTKSQTIASHGKHGLQSDFSSSCVLSDGVAELQYILMCSLV